MNVRWLAGLWKGNVGLWLACLIAGFIVNFVVFKSLPSYVGNYFQSKQIIDVSRTEQLPELPRKWSRIHVAPPGMNLRPGELEVYLPTAVYYPDFPARQGFNLFLNGWARHNTSMSFKCCLLRTLRSGQLDEETYIELQAYNYHEYDQWLVDMQSAEFSCSMSSQQVASVGETANFTHVTFAETSCLKAPHDVLEITYPPQQHGTVGVCLKISYGYVNPQNMLEWFEYQRLMNVTKVFTYTFDLDTSTMRVFEYYQRIGFLDMQPIDPARSNIGPRRGFKRPRFEQQAWVDEVMAANDCKHRMSGYDYVIVMDIDEFIVPREPLRTYHDILQEVSKTKPIAGAFGFDSHVVMLDWGPTRESPLHIMRYATRTTKANYDGVDRNSRWAFKPKRTYYAKNNQVFVRSPYIETFVPHNLYTLLHYRFCKHTWKGCMERERTRDDIMLTHEAVLIEKIRKLPLDQILYNHTSYKEASG